MAKHNEYASFGQEGHTNIYTGEYQKPIIMDYSRGEKNINTLGTINDTTTFNQATNEIKMKLADLLPEEIPTNLLTEEDVINASLIHVHTHKQFITNSEMKWYPLGAIKKLLKYYNIDESFL